MRVYESVTIGVVTYNSESTITETLDSLINQTYPNINIIVSDDCSSDSTANVIENWIVSNDIKNITFKKNNPNLGVSKNLNSILDLVESKWIKFIAGDDLLLPHSISTYMEFVNNCSAKIISSKCMTFGSREEVLPKSAKKVFFGLSAKEQFRYLGIGNFVISPTLFIETEFLKSIGGYNSKFKTVDDLPLLLNCTIANEKIYFIDKVLIKYRIHSGSISLSPMKKKSYKNDIYKIWNCYYSKLGFYYNIHFKILRLSHGIKNRYIKNIVKYSSPLMWKMKAKEILK